MAPRKPVTKTYGKSNKSIHSVDAFNKLFVKNITKRKLNKIQIKALPERVKTILSDDSIDVTTDDTFDRLMKGPLLNNVKTNKSNKNETTFDRLVEGRIVNSFKANRSRKYTTNSTIHSPILTRSRTQRIVRQTKVIPKEYTKSNGSLSISRLKQLTESNERIDQSLIIEKQCRSLRVLRSSPKTYIKLPQTQHMHDKNDQRTEESSVLNNIFTNSVREAITVHSSTPVANIRKKHIIRHPISPIKGELEKVIEISFEEVKKWDVKSPFKNLDVSKRANNSLHTIESFLGFTAKEQSYISTDLFSSEITRHSFINLRTRKINRSRNSSDERENVVSVINENTNSKSISFSLQDFEKFESTHSKKDNSEIKTHSKSPPTSKSDMSFPLDNFEQFAAKYTSGFDGSTVDKCRDLQFFDDLDFISISPAPRVAKKFPDNFFITVQKHKASLFEKKLFKQFRCKELVIEVSPLPLNLVSNGTVNLSNLFNKNLVVNLSNVLNSPTKCSYILSKELKVNITNMPCNADDLDFDDTSDNIRNIPVELVVNVTRMEQIFERFNSSLPHDLSEEKDLPAKIVLDDTCKNSKSTLEIEQIAQCEDREEDECENGNQSPLVIYILSDDSSDMDDVIEDPDFTDNHNSTNYVSDSSTSEISYEVPSKNFEEDLIANLKNNSILTITSPIAATGEGNERLSTLPNTLHDVSQIEPVQTDQVLFKPPLPVLKTPLHLKSGKLWRRSLLTHRRESLLHDRDSNAGSVLNMRASRNRQSTRIVPASGRPYKRTSLLGRYANLSKVTEADLETTKIGVKTRTKTKLRSFSSGQSKNAPLVSAQDIILNKCDQSRILPFESCYPERLLEDCSKIGEGVYGEVFLFNNPNGGTTVMKVIPVEGNIIVNGDKQKKFEEILSEIVITKELSNLRYNKQNQTSSFAEAQRVRCVCGEYPERLLHLWNVYNETKGSENDSPDIFKDDQNYIVFDLANAGRDLEAFVFNNAVQALAMFQQVACALAVAEEELKFEHRDLHWGNVLITEVDKSKEIVFRLKGRTYKIQTKGVCSTIIDFTLSRMECDGAVLFNDLSQDPELFTSEGDYQFDIYRLMQKRNGNDWEKFEPYSNVLWLHYILHKAVDMKGLRYKNPKSQLHKKYLNKLKGYKEDILNYSSVKDFVTSHF